MSKIFTEDKMRKISFIILILLFPILCYSQKEITVERQKAIVDKLAKEINDRYLFKNVGKLIADSLIGLKNEMVKPITISDFSEGITSILRVKGNDSHLLFYYDSLKFKSYLLDESEKNKLEFEREKSINFGFTKVEVLEGNLGYIQMRKFSDFSEDVASKKIASVMNFVQHTNALVLDLRFNPGGQERTIKLLRSYFFSKEVQSHSDSVVNDKLLLELPFDVGDRYLNKPVYILTNEGTFSAAEKFTMSLQQSERAIVIGEKTIGGGHSGRSVSILDGFLAFIPTGGANDQLENKGVTPDHLIKESDALVYAKYLFYTNEIKNVTGEQSDNIEWYITNCKYLLNMKDNDKYEFDVKNIGEYENNRFVLLKDNKPFLKTNNNTYSLIQVSSNEFIIEGDNNFGIGNSRISFNTDKNKLGFDHRVFINDKINHKYFNKIKS